MKALLFADRLEFRKDCPDPAPETDGVIIRVDLAGICATDLEIAKGYMDFHEVLGHEFVGTVVEGPADWNGKRVVGEINCVCQRCDLCQSGLSNHCRKRTILGISGRNGAFAEFLSLPVRNLHEVPSSISDEEAVFVEPLAAAYQVIKQCPIDPRMRVAVVGSGRLGLLVAQVLATTGCRLEVVGRNPHTLLFCEKKGIQSVSVSDVIPRADRDLVVECTGNPQGMELAARLVRPRGMIILKSTYAHSESTNLTPIVVNEIAVLGSRCGPFPDAISALARKEIDVRSMISRQYALEQGSEAFAAADDGRHIKVLLKPRS